MSGSHSLFSDLGLRLIAQCSITDTEHYKEVDFVGLCDNYRFNSTKDFTDDESFGEEGMADLITSAIKDGVLVNYDIDEDIYIIKK